MSDHHTEAELDLVVTDYERAAESVVTVTLEHAAGTELPQWNPGAHIDLVLTAELTRQYSLCGDPADRSRWTIGVLRDPESRGGSTFVHDNIRIGSTVRARGPRNHFPFDPSPRYLFVAGGIGITPMLPMIEAAEAAGADWQLIYCGRSRATMAYLDRLTRYGNRVTAWARDQRGSLHLESVIDASRDDTLVYSCGPERLLGGVEDACKKWPEGSVRLERFAAKEFSESEHAGALDEFEVVCAKSGITINVGPDDNIYDLLEDAGADVVASCMEGVCGTCEATVLEGVPDHRDSILSDSDRKSCSVMMTCVSRSCTKRLVLDL